jgi:hypothetical protein
MVHTKVPIKFLLSHLYSIFVNSVSSKISNWVQHLQTFINTVLITLFLNPSVWIQDSDVKHYERIYCFGAR